MKARMRVTIGPSDVGRRVTLRLRTHAGAGQPSYTDVVGELVAWEGRSLLVRRRHGEVVEVAAVDLVAGRVVPPPSGRDIQ